MKHVRKASVLLYGLLFDICVVTIARNVRDFCITIIIFRQ